MGASEKVAPKSSKRFALSILACVQNALVGGVSRLECSGLVTAILFSRESYPTKLGYDALLERFSPLLNAPSHS
jgi:hypothetical protein